MAEKKKRGRKPKNNIIVNEIEAYKTMLSSVKIDESISGVLFYSPSGIDSYLQENHKGKIAFCIGETTAFEARKHFKNVQVANMPDVDSILDYLDRHPEVTTQYKFFLKTNNDLLLYICDIILSDR